MAGGVHGHAPCKVLLRLCKGMLPVKYGLGYAMACLRKVYCVGQISLRSLDRHKVEVSLATPCYEDITGLNTAVSVIVLFGLCVFDHISNKLR